MFYERFLALCRQHGVSQTTAVTEAGLSKTAYIRWRDGYAPTAKNLKKLAAYFGVSPEYFFDKAVPISDDTKKAAPEGGEDMSATKALLHRLIETMPEDDAERAAKILLAAFPARGE